MTRAVPGFDFAGRIVWITGAASGMGATHTRRFAAAGATVACLDIDLPGAKALAAEISSASTTAVAFEVDVADWDSVQRGADEVRDLLGPVDVVIANAGVLGPDDLLDEIDPNEWRRVIDVNLTGVFHTAKAAIPQLRGRGGSIVIVSSISGLRGYANAAAYNASKHGAIGLMRTLANELAFDGVRVNAVCPGWVDTPMFDAQVQQAGLTREEAIALWGPDQLIERPVAADEISDAILFLCSSLASMITGIALPIDGGMLERTLGTG